MLRIRSLREIRSRHLRSLLEEEADHWQHELEWDYSDIIDAIAAGLDGRTVEGRALVDDTRAVAYCYWLREDGRAVVGSAFASSTHRGRGLEEDLLDAVLGEARSVPGSARVEGQTLFSTAGDADSCYARLGFRSCRRHYMMRPLTDPVRPACHAWRLRPLGREDLTAAADLVFRSHLGTIDAEVNSTYASVERARHFVESLALRDACGRFQTDASFLVDHPSGLAGVILCSRLSANNGHICQVSVAPSLQGRGLGTVLVLSALEALARAGFRTASLSVTAENAGACRLYERLGFWRRRSYGAHAWQRALGRSGW